MTVLKIMIPQDGWAPPQWFRFFHDLMVGLKVHRGAPGLPHMTTTERNSLPAIDGLQIYNTTDSQAQVRENGAWRQI
jgi:hypothetical protein